MSFKRRLTDRGMAREFTRLELRKAEQVRLAVHRYCDGHNFDEVARRLSLPKTLVKKLRGDDVGYLLDAVLPVKLEAGIGPSWGATDKALTFRFTPPNLREVANSGRD